MSRRIERKPGPRTTRVAIITSGFPRLSETFATGELLALANSGVLAGIFATKPGDEVHLQPGSERLLDLLTVLPKGTAAHQAACVVEALRDHNVGAVHGYFAHQPAEVALHAAEQLHVPFGFSVHAKDARKINPETLRARANRASCVVACNSDVASTVRQTGARVHLVPHGVDLKRFNVRPSAVDRPFQILAVGRLVEKKGFHFLIAAVLRLKVPFQLRIIGEGPELERLSLMISANALSGRVTLCGPKTHEQLPEEYARAHVVAVPSVLDQAGDRDGLPNVVLEAMASGRAVVASNVGAIETAVKHEETGLLLRPGDPVSLSDSLTLLAQNETLREKLAHAARKRVEQHYEVNSCSRRFCWLLQEAYA